MNHYHVLGNTLSLQQNGASKPYRYELKTAPTWQFEFQFNIENCTLAMEALKGTLKWELQYFHKKDGVTECVKSPVTHSENKFSLNIPIDVTDYSVTLVPKVNNGTVLNDGFTIAIKKKEQMVFIGKVLKWLDENGEVVPFEDGIRLVKELPAFSGNTEKRSKEYTGAMNEGPVPEGVWWVARDKVETYSSIGYLERMIGSQWHGGEARWGRYRVLLEADNKTDHKGREKLYICGGKLENSGGDIHLKDMCSVL